MSDNARDLFELELRQRVPDPVAHNFLLERDARGRYVFAGTSRDWSFYRAGYAMEQLLLSVSEALRLKELAAWLNSKLPRPKP